MLGCKATERGPAGRLGSIFSRGSSKHASPTSGGRRRDPRKRNGSVCVGGWGAGGASRGDEGVNGGALSF